MNFPATRPRRLRIDKRLRSMVREFSVSAKQLVYPLFVAEAIDKPNDIAAMPGQKQWPVTMIDQPVTRALEHGVQAFILFGVPAAKNSSGSTAVDDESVVCRAIKRLKKHCPDAFIITDVCLCAYTDHGHCGLLHDQEVIDNDATCAVLADMALAHVRAGADMVAPSDMMDGRIGYIRKKLDDKGFRQTPIMSYSAKYASSFYGPFREAAGSSPGKGDRRGYQMDYANSRDAMLEMQQDLNEGADILMVKPGIAYLDILHQASERFSCPLAVYQVSGEYSMICAAAEKGWVSEKDVVLESIIAMRRAGADLILTYFAPKIALWLKEEKA